jgi:hypothetical protein
MSKAVSSPKPTERVTEEATKSCNLSSYSYLPEYASIIEIELTAIPKDEESDTPEVAAH